MLNYQMVLWAVLIFPPAWCAEFGRCLLEFSQLVGGQHAWKASTSQGHDAIWKYLEPLHKTLVSKQWLQRPCRRTVAQLTAALTIIAGSLPGDHPSSFSFSVGKWAVWDIFWSASEWKPRHMAPLQILFCTSVTNFGNRSLNNKDN